MAIAKVGSAGKSAGAIAYVLSENKDATKEPEILAGSFGTASEIKREFEVYNKLNTRVKNQATHISISFAPGEKVQVEKKIEFAEKLLEKLDFNNVPFLIVEHHDKEYEHFHIIAGRIRDDGTTVEEWKIAERAIAATKEIEKSLGLERTEYVKSGDRQLKSAEYKQMERTSELSVMAEAKLTIDEILKQQPDVRDFVERLQQSGFDVRPNLSEKTGRMNGFSFKKGEITFKSSAIAKNYSWQNLQKNGLNYDHDRDTEYLRGVKNEFTEKLGFEGGRCRDFENSESIADRAESAFERTKSTAGRAESNDERPRSDDKGNNQNEFEIQQNRNTGSSNQPAETKLGKIQNLPVVLEAAKQPPTTEVSGGTVFEFGHRRESKSSTSNRQDYSGTGKSAHNLIEIDVTATTPKFNPAPERRTEANNSKDYSKNIERERGMSR